jgi:hypothetical protein
MATPLSHGARQEARGAASGGTSLRLSPFRGGGSSGDLTSSRLRLRARSRLRLQVANIALNRPEAGTAARGWRWMRPARR